MTSRLSFAVAVELAVALSLSSTARAITVCPGPNAVYGIDVSEFQGNINWGQVKAAGKEFAIIRVSDGTGHLDPYFAQNWAGAKNAGLIRGVYQFFEPGGDAVAQANLLLQKMGPIGPNDLPPMIDVEATGGQSPATINSKVHQWIDTVQAATGRKPLIYTGSWFWDPDVQSGDFVSYPLVDSYYCNNCCPNIASPWTKWTMWQYSSTGAVGGIAGNVDLDRFDGTLAELQKLAGGSVDWSASYVSQSWPLASMAMTMTVNESVPAKITMKNTGGKAWGVKTFLGTTQARDRASVFVAPDWSSDHRPAACDKGAAPGQNCDFTFTFHAPNTPGEFKEFFGFVEEGVAWFSDQGQGGPADSVVEAWIKVVEAEYHGEFVKQSYPLAPAPLAVAVGDTTAGWIELKNVGTQPWKAGQTKLVPTPRDKPSPLGAADWLSPTRVSTLAADVAPGAIGRFPLSLHASAAGDFSQTFTLLEEGVTWFADAPKGGGPSDTLLRVHVVATTGAPIDGGMPASDAATAKDGAAPGSDLAMSGGSDGGAGGGDAGGGGNVGGGGSVSGGCSVGARETSNARVAALVFAMLSLALVVRSKRRRD